MLRSRAASRHTGAALTAPEVAINFRSQLRLCSLLAYRSIVPPVHLTRYFPRHASVPFHRYLGTVALRTRERQSLDRRFARLAPSMWMNRVFNLGSSTRCFSDEFTGLPEFE